MPPSDAKNDESATLRIAVVGGGLGGLGAAISLQRAGGSPNMHARACVGAFGSDDTKGHERGVLLQAGHHHAMLCHACQGVVLNDPGARG